MVGSWKVNVTVDAMPQKVATAISKLSETLIGAEYTPIAYLGYQEVNGINRAVLAEQIITTGRDTKNIVVLIFNEKPNEMEATLVGIERVVEGGGELGGMNVDAKTDIPADAKKVWDNAFERGFVGADVKPFALLGSQIVNGAVLVFAAEVTPVVENPESKVAIVTVNELTKEVLFTDLLESKHEAALGYSFTWLKNRGLGDPLGEWP